MARRRSDIVAAPFMGLIAMLIGIVVAASAFAGSGGGPVTVLPGHVLKRDVTGFAADAPVSERLAGHTYTTVVHSDASGVVHVAYRVPNRPGEFQLTLVGRSPAAASASPQPAPSGPGDQQVITVEVPKLVVIDFIVKRRGGLGIKGVHTGPRGRGGSGSAPGGTADTGVDIQALLELAGAVLACGLILVGAGSRPRRPRSCPS